MVWGACVRVLCYMARNTSVERVLANGVFPSFSGFYDAE